MNAIANFVSPEFHINKMTSATQKGAYEMIADKIFQRIANENGTCRYEYHTGKCGCMCREAN